MLVYTIKLDKAKLKTIVICLKAGQHCDDVTLKRLSIWEFVFSWKAGGNMNWSLTSLVTIGYEI